MSECIQKLFLPKPKIKTWELTRLQMKQKVLDAGLHLPADDLPWDNRYVFTDDVGWSEVLYHLAFSSGLFKPDIFDCENYAFKAWLKACEEYDLNTLCVTIGSIPKGRHGFNILFRGDGFALFEPNAGFEGSGAFEIGDYGYQPDNWYG